MASNRELEKTAAAAAALELVEDGMQVGLGSGSTSEVFVRLLAERVRQGLNVCGVATSSSTQALAQREGIPLSTLNETPRLDLTIDGADEVDPQLCLIKGGGGALLREKVVAANSQRVVILVDSGKMKATLGAFPLPVEVTQFAWKPIASNLSRLAKSVELRMREGAPLVTDEGNYILDCRFESIANPAALSDKLDHLAGVMEHGLFVGLADQVIVGRGNVVETINRQNM